MALLSVLALVVLLAGRADGPQAPGLTAGRAASAGRAPGSRPRALYAVAPAASTLAPRLHGALRSGIVFDVRTGRVLWQRDPARRLPIASLTKMMTALLVASSVGPRTQVMITREVLAYSGSGIGLLPRGRRVPALALLYGLLLPSGNDAAIALALHLAQTQARFVALMNARARAMGLTCTHFTSVSGIVDQGNYSCARDLARLAHTVLEQPLLRRIVATGAAVLPFPIRGGRLYLYNNNPLMRERYPGIDGVKTGYTVAAGSCLVASARRRGRWLAVVLLHSANTAGQAATLLNLGFRAPAL